MRASSCSREQGRVTCWRTTDVSRAAACVSRGFSMRHLLSKRDTADLAALPIIPPSYHPDVLRPRGPALTIDGAVKIAAAVSEAEPQKGYAVIMMRAFEPQRRPGQPNFPAEAEVTTVRYGADLTSTAPGAGP